MSGAKERKKNDRCPYHSFEKLKQEMKKKKFFKEKNVSPKERHTSLGEKGMNDYSRRKMPPRFLIPPPISPRQNFHVVKRKKFP